MRRAVILVVFTGLVVWAGWWAWSSRSDVSLRVRLISEADELSGVEPSFEGPYGRSRGPGVKPILRRGEHGVVALSFADAYVPFAAFDLEVELLGFYGPEHASRASFRSGRMTYRSCLWPRHTARLRSGTIDLVLDADDSGSLVGWDIDLAAFFPDGRPGSVRLVGGVVKP